MKKSNLDLVTYVIIGTLVGGRLGYMLLYDFQGFIETPLNLFKVWEGGMASHGGFVGIAISLILFAKFNKISFLKLSDIAVTLGTPGLFFGRIANFINAELWGKISDVPWAVQFSYIHPITGLRTITEPRHASQLYEAFLE